VQLVQCGVVVLAGVALHHDVHLARPQVGGEQIARPLEFAADGGEEQPELRHGRQDGMMRGRKESANGDGARGRLPALRAGPGRSHLAEF
jgi:hypothetical protein